MKFIGTVVTILFILGLIGIIDFHICVKGPGQCSCRVSK